MWRQYETKTYQPRFAVLRLIFKFHVQDLLGFHSTLRPLISSWDLLISLISSIIPRSRTAMSPPPNEVYSAFSFIGFVLCAIPFYWHLEGMWKYSYDLSSPKNVRLSLEYGHLLVHVLGRAWMSNTMHQFDCLEQKYDQQGSRLLRYL
jgi:hypothetical protein